MPKTLLLFLFTAVAYARMSVEDVLRLVKAGVSEEIILVQIQKQHAAFDLTPDQLIQLKRGHVSDRIIRVMMATARSAEPSRAAPTPARSPVKLAAVSVPAAAVPVHWTPHNDPKGFSINVPTGWELRSDHASGRIALQGPQGQKAIIWPMFLERRNLQASQAGALVKQLAGRVSPELPWGSPELMTGAARVLARGNTNGAAIIRWNGVPDGTVVYLFLVSAPAPLYRDCADVFTGILQSFHVTPAAPEKQVHSAPAPPPLKWTRWTDPREGAFGVSVPQGWSVTGGSVRHSATDVRKSIIVVAPDGQIRITVGDANIGVFTAPNPMYGRAGLRGGMSASLGDGTHLQIHSFLPASQFLRQYITGPALRECAGVSVLSEEQRQDLAAAAQQEISGQGAGGRGIGGARVTSAGVSFSCTWNGKPAHGYYAAATTLVQSQMGGLWFVEPLYGYVATSERQQEAEIISRHVAESTQANSDWKRQEDLMAADAVRADNERAAQLQAQARKSIADSEQATSDMIVKGYQQRSQVYDEIARRRENAILGTVDVVDPSTGNQYKIDNMSDYHWMNNQGVIAGTKTDTAPGSDWRQMITLP
jgi:hypothetical protein